MKAQLIRNGRYCNLWMDWWHAHCCQSCSNTAMTVDPQHNSSPLLHTMFGVYGAQLTVLHVNHKCHIAGMLMVWNRSQPSSAVNQIITTVQEQRGLIALLLNLLVSSLAALLANTMLLDSFLHMPTVALLVAWLLKSLNAQCIRKLLIAPHETGAVWGFDWWQALSGLLIGNSEH